MTEIKIKWLIVVAILAAGLTLLIGACSSSENDEIVREWQEAIEQCGAEAPWVEIREEGPDSPAISIGSKSDHPAQFDADVAICLAERLDMDTEMYERMKAREEG